MDTFSFAKQFSSLGISVIPIRFRDKRPEFSLLPKNEEGDPGWEVFKKTLPTIDQLASWFSGQRNYGVVCGWNNLAILDFDDIDEYNRWLYWAMSAQGITKYVADYAFRVSTSRGVHVYIRLPHKEKNRKLGKIDVKGDGYVLGPGSVHPSGAIYTPMRDCWNFPLVSALSDVLPASLLLPATKPAAAPVWQPTMPAGPVNGGLIKKIKSTFKIESFFPNARKSGNGWMLDLCPLHDDHSPSFWINTEQQICGCFAGCTDKPLDVINLYGRLHGLSNTEAIRAMGQM
jgi:hypothetical protein